MMTTQLFFLLLVLDCSLMWVHGDCPEHQHHSECGAGCQINCEERNEPKPCNKMCVAGCVCDKGWILERAGSHTCIPKGHCKTCPKNTHFSECGAKCQRTCENYKQENIPCPMMCAPGCVCDKGYALHNGKCIHTSECVKH
ncbi:von Willebrand factor-like [Pleurodeles waltl]|uniref:von Willebrand factor-like n=1 Tax=Pleurodeles waltl TaxID=8319 RepID=UPI0037097863